MNNTDFLLKNSTSILSILKDVKAARKIFFGLEESEQEELQLKVDKKISGIYDKENVELVSLAIFCPEPWFDADTIVQTAQDVEYRHGTEMTMTLECLETALRMVMHKK